MGLLFKFFKINHILDLTLSFAEEIMNPVMPMLWMCTTYKLQTLVYLSCTSQGKRRPDKTLFLFSTSFHKMTFSLKPGKVCIFFSWLFQSVTCIYQTFLQGSTRLSKPLSDFADFTGIHFQMHPGKGYKV